MNLLWLLLCLRLLQRQRIGLSLELERDLEEDMEEDLEEEDED